MHFVIVFLFLGLFMGILFSGIYAQELILPPKQQLKAGVAIHDIKCKAEFELVFKATDGSPACVKPTSVEKLIARGWATDQSPPESSEDDVTVGDGVTLGDSDKIILMFSPDPSFDVLLNQRLGPEDYIGSGQSKILDRFSIPKTILIVTSIADVQSTIPMAQLNGYDAIAYDNEGWDLTPQEEKDNPAKSTDTASGIVRNAQLEFVSAADKKHMELQYLGVDWTKVDLTILQLQKARSNQEFIDLATQFASHIKQTSPDTKITVQVNTYFASLDEIENRIKAVENLIDGYSIICQKTSQGCTLEDLDSLLTVLGR